MIFRDFVTIFFVMVGITATAIGIHEAVHLFEIKFGEDNVDVLSVCILGYNDRNQAIGWVESFRTGDEKFTETFPEIFMWIVLIFIMTYYFKMMKGEKQ